jgi:hypothetical protein
VLALSELHFGNRREIVRHILPFYPIVLRSFHYLSSLSFDLFMFICFYKRLLIG